MRAWRLTAPGEIVLTDVESQPVGPGCVKIKLRYSAISGTDILMYKGTIPFEVPIVPGRQGIGMVTEVGEGVKNVVRGDIVAIKPFVACGGCAKCKSGKPSECLNKLIYGLTEDGFLCDFVVVHSDDVYKLPDRVDKKRAILLEHIDMAITTVANLKLQRGEHVVINGASYLGIIIAQLALSNQAIPILIDIDKNRLAIAERYAYYVIDYAEADVRKRILTITGGKMSENVVHLPLSGMPFNQVLALARDRGKVVMAGWENTVDISGANIAPILNKQLTVMGINGSNNNFPAAINMLVNHTVDVEFDNVPEISFADVGSALKDLDDNSQKFIYTRVVME